jgi:hypothetical protein
MTPIYTLIGPSCLRYAGMVWNHDYFIPLRYEGTIDMTRADMDAVRYSCASLGLRGMDDHQRIVARWMWDFAPLVRAVR